MPDPIDTKPDLAPLVAALAVEEPVEDVEPLARALAEARSLLVTSGNESAKSSLAGDIKRAFELGWPLDDAVVAHADAVAAATGAVTPLLVRLAGNDVDVLELPDGSVGHALASGWLHGLQATSGPTTVRIEWVVLHFSEALGRGRIWWALSLEAGDGAVRSDQAKVRGRRPERRHLDNTAMPGALLRRPVDPAWRARTEAALAAALASDPDRPSCEGLVDAVGPSGPTGLAAWLLARGAELLAEAPPLVAVDHADDRWELVSLGIEERGSTLYWLVRLTRSRGGEVVDVEERELMFPELDPELHEVAAPAVEMVATAALEAFRGGLAFVLGQLQRMQPDERCTLIGLDVPSPLALMGQWITEGPPGPLPRPVQPPLAPDEAVVRRVATRLRWFDPGELTAARSWVDPQVLAAVVLDEWTMVFCPDHLGEGFSEDRIYLQPPGGEPLAIVMNDPWNGHVMPIDGDRELLRAVARFLREVLTLAGCDVAFERKPSSSDEDEELDPDRLTLIEWLAFGFNDTPRWFTRIDWRLGVGDSPDVIAPFDFWDRGPFAMGRDEKERYRAGIASHYHRFIREVIDPGFRGGDGLL